MTKSSEQQSFSQTTAIAVVIANMIGTGVFTSLGFQLLKLPPILFLLVIGWTLIYILKEKPTEALWSLLLIGIGGGFYLVSNWLGRKR